MIVGVVGCGEIGSGAVVIDERLRNIDGKKGFGGRLRGIPTGRRFRRCRLGIHGAVRELRFGLGRFG